MASILDYPIGYRGLVLNGHRTVEGEYDKSKELSTYLIEEFDFSRLQIRDQREGLHLDTGGMLGPATKVFRYVSLQGSVRALDEQQLEDFIARLFHVFDVEEAQIDEPFYRGAHILDFWTPTRVPAYEPLVHEMFLGRPSAFLRAFERRSTGHTMAFGAELVCPDPRRYMYDITTVMFSDAEGWSHPMPNWTNLMGTEVAPFVTIVLDEPGETDFTIHDSGEVDAGHHLVLDLSLATAGATHTVDMATGQILRASDGESHAYFRKSDVDSFCIVPAGGSPWLITNHDGVASVTVEYRQARS